MDGRFTVGDHPGALPDALAAHGNPNGRKCGQWIIGIGIGLHFTPAVIEQVAGHFALILFGALFTTFSSVISVWLLRRTGEDRATAFFASMPGGAGRWSTSVRAMAQ